MASPRPTAGAPRPVEHLRVDVITIFPEYLAPLQLSLIGKAARRGRLTVAVHDLRSWTSDVHHTVDDAPFGGGPGMVMKAEPWAQALEHVTGAAPSAAGPILVVPTPAGRPFTQRVAEQLAGQPWLVFACGRYEGIDTRLVQWAADRMAVQELSLGDYVLAGGEVATLVMVEAVARLLPGVLGNPASAEDDSHAGDGLLEGPVYTRPAQWRGRDVPPVLLSGDHGAVQAWRREQSRARTTAVRPDLAAQIERTGDQR